MNQSDVDAVSVAHEEFYAAFEALDMDRMTACWRQDGTVRCVHPGADAVVGWPRVSRSWAALFLNAPNPRFVLTDVEIHVDGDLAVAHCTENVLSGPELDAGQVLATNVFHRVGDRWLLVLRHASPVLRL